MNDSKLSILVPSCDKYSDLWKPFFHQFFKHWESCPYKMYLGTNHKDFQHPRVEVIKVGDDISWATGMRTMVDQIKSENILIILEDFFLRKDVSDSDFTNLLEKYEYHKSLMLRLSWAYGWPNKRNSSGFQVLEPNRRYRICLHPAIWRKTFLDELLVEGDSAWAFEVNASNRSMKYSDGIFCTGYRPLEWDHHVVEKGKWFLPAAKKFAKMDIGCDFGARGVMTISEHVKWFLSHEKGRLEYLLIPIPLYFWLKSVKKKFCSN